MPLSYRRKHAVQGMLCTTNTVCMEWPEFLAIPCRNECTPPGGLGQGGDPDNSHHEQTRHHQEPQDQGGQRLSDSLDTTQVSNPETTEWRLDISQVKRRDAGWYMCQVPVHYFTSIWYLCIAVHVSGTCTIC